MGYRTRRRKAIIRRRIFLSLCSVILVAVIGIASLVIFSLAKPEEEKTPTPPKEEIKESYAKVLSTGDIMVHTPQLYGAKNQNGEYDFSHFFKEARAYFKNYDLNVANLEVTFGGEESGKFDGYPKFNTPDTLADAIKNSGLNFLITSNNHSYDTGLYGLKRTAKILGDKGIEFIGTRETAEKPLYTVKEINDIKIGMANFTYETSGSTPGRKFLNGSIIAEEANVLISSFSYNRIEEFYLEAERTIKDMENQGAEFIVFYIHWGEVLYKVQERKAAHIAFLCKR
jgi:poly-gamma-glutamate synthesis protein (capsule biosynthesis protein)